MIDYYNINYIKKISISDFSYSDENKHYSYEDGEWFYIRRDDYSGTITTKGKINISRYISSNQFIENNKIYDKPSVNIFFDDQNLEFVFNDIKQCKLLVDILNNKKFTTLTVSIQDLVDEIKKFKDVQSYLRSKKINEILK